MINLGDLTSWKYKQDVLLGKLTIKHIVFNRDLHMIIHESCMFYHLICMNFFEHFQGTKHAITEPIVSMLQSGGCFHRYLDIYFLYI